MGIYHSFHTHPIPRQPCQSLKIFDRQMQIDKMLKIVILLLNFLNDVSHSQILHFRREFLVLSVNFDGPSLDFLGSRKPVHDQKAVPA